MSGSLIEAIRCPRCAATLDLRALAITCTACGRSYPRYGQIPVLLPDPDSYLASCRRQLALFEQQAALTLRVIERESRAADVLPLARARCRGMFDAVRAQVADVRAILQPLDRPAVGPESDTTGDAEPDVGGDSPDDGVPSPLKYISNLYRDWGWPAEPDGENERALASIEAVLDLQPLGRTVVLGAGACRLAYDLHRRHPDTETLAIDIDPLLFAAAHTVIRGGAVTLREANAEIDELGHVCKEWTLTARHEVLSEERFHFLIADGLEPPIAPGVFDTVLTPWFIDLVPTDLRDFIGTIHGLLRPGGRWLSMGPLRYTLDLPVARRFTREEVFDLAERAGFRLGKWRAATEPYLVSKLSGRGKAEWVLTFLATKFEDEGSAPFARSTGHGEGPPAWVLFPHLPIPTFAGQSLIVVGDPLSQTILSAIDGRRTLDDLTRLVASRINQAGVSPKQVRDAVRRFLLETHPDLQRL